MVPFPFHPGMTQWLQQGPKPKPKKQYSEKKLARIQKRTEKFKASREQKDKNKSVPMEVDVANVKTVDASTQTDKVFILEHFPDPTASVIREDKKLSKLAFEKKQKARSNSKSVENSMTMRETKANSTQSSSSTGSKASSTKPEAYEPPFISVAAEAEFKRLSVSQPYTPNTGKKADNDESILESDNE